MLTCLVAAPEDCRAADREVEGFGGNVSPVTSPPDSYSAHCSDKPAGGSFWKPTGRSGVCAVQVLVSTHLLEL